MNEKKEIVNLSNINVDYDGHMILQQINLSIKEYDFLGIIGPNGGGKTTLLKVILGLIPLRQGRVEIFGGSPDRARRFIGYVPQTSIFDREFPISVWDVALMGRLCHVNLFKGYGGEDKEITQQALKTVDMLDYKDKQIGTLSGGQKQRVYIARALATKPKLLLLDEPTASIDSPMQASFYELLKELRKEMAIVLVSHDIGVISNYVEKIACLNRNLFYHDVKEITVEDLEQVYRCCSIEVLAHGIPHRIMKEHKQK